MDYIGNREVDNKAMLEALGINSVEELLGDIPAENIIKGELNLPPALAEAELKKLLQDLSAENINVSDYSCFLGGGAYDHYIPSVVKTITSRSEFYTAYTPYQPEISQGTLQAIFEYQSLICTLTGMDVANASLYDGATALYEAAHLACDFTGRQKIILGKAVHPHYRQVLHTYLHNSGVTIEEINCDQGICDIDELQKSLDEKVAAVIIQQPNFFGCLEQVEVLSKLAHTQGALLVTSVYPLSLGVLKRPSAYGADIVVGEGQSLGLPLSFGGPYLGIFACRKDFMRKMPGRIVGQTVDGQGRRAYVLTLQTREQHIRRERATSNICSNEALCALAATVYLSAMGAKGLRRAALLSTAGSHYLADKIAELPGWKINFQTTSFFNEFVATAPVEVGKINRNLLKKKIIGGLSLEKYYPELKNAVLFCVTEKRTKTEIEELLKRLADF